MPHRVLSELWVEATMAPTVSGGTAGSDGLCLRLDSRDPRQSWIVTGSVNPWGPPRASQYLALSNQNAPALMTSPPATLPSARQVMPSMLLVVGSQLGNTAATR